MPIKILPPSGLCFVDVNDIPRIVRGVALSKRSHFQSLCIKALSAYNEAIGGGSEWEELWEIHCFRSTIVQILDLAHLKVEWLVKDDVSLIPQLILTYVKDQTEYLGDWTSWEFPSVTTPASSGSSNTSELQAFTSLLLQDIHGGLIEIFPLPVSAYFRFVDLLDAMLPLMDSGFHNAYDNDPIFARLINEALSLFGLSPDHVSASMAYELLICDWEDEGGQKQCFPGWLQQLCNPPVKYQSKGGLLPKEESPHHATIAALWGEGKLRDAIADANAIPYPDLRGILHSRSRMIDDAMDRARGKNSVGKGQFTDAEQKVLESIDYDALQKEFFEDWFIPTEPPDRAIGSSNLV